VLFFVAMLKGKMGWLFLAWFAVCLGLCAVLMRQYEKTLIIPGTLALLMLLSGTAIGAVLLMWVRRRNGTEAPLKLSPGIFLMGASVFLFGVPFTTGVLFLNRHLAGPPVDKSKLQVHERVSTSKRSRLVSVELQVDIDGFEKSLVFRMDEASTAAVASAVDVSVAPGLFGFPVVVDQSPRIDLKL
jgi:hypothetical protein